MIRKHPERAGRKAVKRGGGKAKGSHWIGSRRWRRLTARIEKRNRRFPKPIPVFGECRRCGRRFVPGWIERLGKFDNCCSRCQVKNLADGLNIPELRDMAGIPRDEK